jgi:hypothetical protein
MAGGPNAEVVPCWHCAEPAHRIREGLETDSYRCSGCGCQITINYEECGPPDAPMWPPTEEQRAEILKIAALGAFGPCPKRPTQAES